MFLRGNNLFVDFIRCFDCVRIVSVFCLCVCNNA